MDQIKDLNSLLTFLISMTISTFFNLQNTTNENDVRDSYQNKIIYSFYHGYNHFRSIHIFYCKKT